MSTRVFESYVEELAVDWFEKRRGSVVRSARGDHR